MRVNSELIVPTILALTLTSSSLAAQTVTGGTEDLDFNRPEAWAMKYFATVSLMSSMGAPRDLEPGSIDLGFEGGWIPHLSEDQRRVGFNGTKLEDMNKTPFFGRLRATVGLPGKFSISVGFVPPIDLGGAKPNLFAAALARPIFEPRWGRLGIRAFGQLGTIKGDFTCSEKVVAAGQDLNLNPFRCEAPSNDKATLRYLAAELSHAFTLTDPRFEPYVAVSLIYSDLKFQVDALYSGVHDRTLQLTHGVTFSVSGGVAVKLSELWRVSAELFYSPLDVVRPPETTPQNDGLLNVRGMVQYSIR